MSNSETQRQETQHAFLVVWGWFAEHLGLIQQFQALSLKQKHYHHRPPGPKVLTPGNTFVLASNTSCPRFWTVLRRL